MRRLLVLLVVVVHRTRSVVVKARYLDLRRHHVAGHPIGRHALRTARYLGSPVPCGGMRHTISYRRDDGFGAWTTRVHRAG